jgi:hypothetical protein
LLTGDEAR